MDDAQALWLVESMRAKGVEFEPGLSERQLASVQVQWGICFPPDLAALLRHGVPVRRPPQPPLPPELVAQGVLRIPPPQFPKWNQRRDQATAKMLREPEETVVFHARYSQLWLPSWGPRPPRWALAQAVVRDALRAVPRLLPVDGSNFVPERPVAGDCPVICFSGGEVETAANDLAGFFSKSFGFERPPWAQPTRSRVEFWETEEFFVEDLGQVAPRGYWADLPDEGAPPHS